MMFDDNYPVEGLTRILRCLHAAKENQLSLLSTKELEEFARITYYGYHREIHHELELRKTPLYKLLYDKKET